MTTTTAPQKKETFRIARYILKANEKQLKVLPDDQWLMGFAKTQYRENKDFKSGILSILRPTIFAAVSVIGAVAAGVAALSFPVVGLSVAALALTSGVFSGLSAKRAVKRFKTDVAPKMQKIIGESFIKSEGQEIKSNFKKNFEENLAARRKVREQEEAAAAEAEKAKPKAAPKDTPATPAERTPQTPQNEKTIESGADLAKAAFNFARNKGGKALKNQINRFKKKKGGSKPA